MNPRFAHLFPESVHWAIRAVTFWGVAALGQDIPENNGAPSQPVYLCAHNPNTVADAEEALDNFANALEPDVTEIQYPVYSTPLDNLVNWDSSAPYRGGRVTDTGLIDWLKGVHNLALKRRSNGSLAYPNFSLVVFDIKPSAGKSKYGVPILQAIRKYLNTDGVNLYVILSIGSRDDGAVFNDLIGPRAKLALQPNEGLQIDEEDDPGSVTQYFLDRGYSENISYGNGTASFGNGKPGGKNLLTSIDAAVFDRAAFYRLRLVTYVYAIGSVDTMRTFLDAGVGGIIPDKFPPASFSDSIPSLQFLSFVVAGRTDVRHASPQDNPFSPIPPEAYAIKVKTAHDSTPLGTGDRGTDANITFTLNGEFGSSQIVVNTKPVGRMESDIVNYVTIRSRNLGSLRSITISNDGSGNAPGWLPEYIEVYSARWLTFGNHPAYYHASLNEWIEDGDTKTFSFRTQEYVRQSGTLTSDGSSGAPWHRVSEAYDSVAPQGTIYLGAGQYSEHLKLVKPLRMEHWNDGGIAPAEIGVQSRK